ncbi:MAG TPA: hypothetical protein DDW28_01150 [Prevotella sp.]|nr:hypothetical protein [Candidatus Segatella violae]
MKKKQKKEENVFQRIAEHWFLSEPVLFATYCSHHLKPNSSIACTMRTGKGCIEYNPELTNLLTEQAIEENLKVEMIRILLKHPYDRQPKDCSAMACTLGSDCTLSSYYDNWKYVNLAKPSDFQLPEKEYFEWYAINIDKLIKKEGTSSEGNSSSNGQEASEREEASEGKNLTKGDTTTEEKNDSVMTKTYDYAKAKAEQSALWEEDELMQISINTIIENAKNWGTIPGNLVEQIIASTKARIDYRKVISGFRASCISMRRTLTRMRPNRRTGFQNMGSIYRYKTNLLVAVDVSGSVTSKTLAHFYSVINRFFHYGIENIDVMQFDCAAGEVKNIKKASHKIEIFGRGGTDFQCVIDYAQQAKCYDGVIIMTDGYAPPPVLPPHFRPHLLWICENEDSYKQHHEWMEKLGRACTINL